MRDKLPHMPLYVYDIESDADCRAMNDAQFGRFMRLLIRQWMEASVPANPTQAVRDAMLDTDSVASTKALLEQKFRVIVKGGGRANKRLADIRTKVLRKVKNLRANASMGGRAKALANAKANGPIRASESVSVSDSESDPVIGEGAGGADRGRHRNALWDAVAAEFFPGGVEGPTRKRVGKLVQQFKDLKATPEQIRERKLNLERAWGRGVTVTPDSLVKHWGSAQAIHQEHRDGHAPSTSPTRRSAALGANGRRPTAAERGEFAEHLTL